MPRINLDTNPFHELARNLDTFSKQTNTSNSRKVVVNYTNGKSFTLRNTYWVRTALQGRVTIAYRDVTTLIGNVTIESENKVHIPIDNISSIQIFFEDGTVISRPRESLK